MKLIEEVKKEYTKCPKGHGLKHLRFAVEFVRCDKCNEDYDLGPLKYD